jgi:hypothetical protein
MLFQFLPKRKNPQLIPRLLSSGEEMKDKKHELEFSWICDESKQQHAFLTKEQTDKLTTDALKAIEDEQMDES